jgi:hypothetical protein
MRRLNAAYAVLGDPKRRARSDARFAPDPPTHRPRARMEQRPRARIEQRRRAQPQLALASQRAHGSQLLARILVVVLLIAMTIGALLCAWVLLVDPDDRPAPGFRPRGAAPEITVPSAVNVRPSR